MDKNAGWLLLKNHGIIISDRQWDRLSQHLNAASHHFWKALSSPAPIHKIRYLGHVKICFDLLVSWGLKKTIFDSSEWGFLSQRTIQEIDDLLPLSDVWSAGEYDQDSLPGTAHPADSCLPSDFLIN